MREYLEAFDRWRRIPRDEEVPLILAAQAGDDAARERMILGNIPLAVSVAKRYRNHGLDFEDLVQEGVFGLDMAVRRFDPAYRSKFSTYAVPWIKTKILTAVRSNPYPVRLPVYLHDLLPKVEQIEEDLGRWPSEHEAAGAGVTTERIWFAVTRAIAVTRSGIGDDYLDERPGSEPCPLDAAADREEVRGRAALIGRLMGELTHREREILRRRFGLDGGATETLREISARLHITRERVRQIQREAIAKMRLAAPA